MGELGRTGFEVSALGFGAGVLDGALWRDLDPRRAQQTLREALEVGVSFVAAGPALGADEQRLVGDAIRDVRARDRAVVATGLPPAVDDDRLDRAFPAEHVVRSVENALRAQRAEALWIAQLGSWRHGWRAGSAWAELRGVMARLIRQGKVLTWGIVADDPEPAMEVLDDDAISSIQIRHNLLSRADETLVSRAVEREVGVIGCAPLAGGALGGELGAEPRFPPGDWRTTAFTGERWRGLREDIAPLVELVGDEVDTLPELALRFALGTPGIATVACGTRRPEHLRANLHRSDGRGLSAELSTRIAEATGSAAGR